MDYATRLKLSSVMVKYSQEYRAKNVKEWLRVGERNLANAARKDANDLRKVGTLLRTEGVEAARKFADNLDTIVRDAIPREVWEALFLNDDQDEIDIDAKIEVLERMRASLDREIETYRQRRSS